MKYELKDLVKDREVVFSYYVDQELWYSVEGTDFSFPVSIEEAKGGLFKARDKAILFMRYIRKHINGLEKAKKDHEQEFGMTSANKQVS